MHVLETTINRKSGSNYGWVFSPNFDLGHPRSPKVNYQGKIPKIDFLYLFTERWCVARSRNHHQSKEWVKLQVGLFSEFWFRSPKVTQGQLSRKNTKNRFSVPFYGQMVRCTFSQPPPIERAVQSTGGSLLRFFIKVTQGHPRSIIKGKHQKSTFCTFLRRDGELHVLATTTNRKSGSNYRWVFPLNFH